MGTSPEELRILELRLADARERAKQISTATTRQTEGEEAIRAARSEVRSEVLSLERQLAAAKGDQWAEPFGFPVRWDVGAPCPHLLVNDYKAFLIFYLSVPNPTWDGTYVTAASTSSEASLALVEFERCKSAKLGGPNDEVLWGHPLSGRGLESYTAQMVHNSIWLAELEKINSVHRYYSHDHWIDLKHYIFWFHDSTFECLANSYTVELFDEPLDELLARTVKRLNS